MNSDKRRSADWKLIDSYFKSPKNDKFISNHHLLTYNSFIREKIPYVIKTFDPLFTIPKEKHDIHVHIGGLNNDEIYIGRPCIKDKGDAKVLYPNVARLNDNTYESVLSVGVTIEYTTKKDQSVIIAHEEKIPIARIPVMIHSDVCVLKDLEKNQLVQCGECPYDQGGYFIIDGKEKVIVSQERIATNKLFLSYTTSDDSSELFSHVGIIRSTSIENSLFPKTIKFRIHQSELRRNAIVISLPNIFVHPNELKSNVPLFVLFRALGVESDTDILKCIFPYQSVDRIPMKYMNMIRKTVHEGSIAYTQEEALLYLSRFGKYKDPSPFSKTDTKYINYIRYLLAEDVFPNVGTYGHFAEKAVYLGHLTFKMVRFALGEQDVTNRESYMYKRVQASGDLMMEVFRDGFNELRNHVKNKIDREYNYGKFDEDTKKITDLRDTIRSSNKYIFDQEIISDFIRKSFKKSWGMKKKEGIVQDLSRLSYIGYASHVRRVNTPMSRSIKLVDPHKADASHWGYMCPTESPDGENIGLLKHMATFCHLSADSKESSMMECLQDHAVMMLDDVDISLNKEVATTVLLNNNLVGYHASPKDLVDILRLLKRNNFINTTISISWNIFEREIEIFTDGGRCVRPLYVTSDVPKVDSILDETTDGDVWTRFVFEHTELAYNKKEYRNVMAKQGVAGLRERASPIEFIDSMEMSRALIAISQTTLAEHPLQTYDYIEIHPTAILSMYTNTIPLAHHNQAPRNMFSGQQGKQAVGVYASTFNNRIDTASYILHYPQKALLTTKYAKYFHIDKLPNGENVIVAIATYTGYNQEDSIIINKSSVERGMFNTSIFKAYIDSEKMNEFTGDRTQFGNPIFKKQLGVEIEPKYAVWDHIDEDGYPKENSYIKNDHVFLGKIQKTKREINEFEERDVLVDDYDTMNATNVDNVHYAYKDKSQVANFTNGGMVDKVYVYDKNGETKIKIRFRKTREPVLGDKFASRHGQKGVIGMMLPQEDMPFTKDGLVPDLIVNPHAFPSRMTIGHIIEAVLAKYACVSGHMADGTTFETLDKEAYFDLLTQYGYNRHGNEAMYNGFTGEQIQTDIFVGPTYYYRLKHMVQDKFNYRNGVDPSDSPLTSVTHQPTQGRANQGGLRIGEMETNCLISHGIGSFIRESMMERSDGHKVVMDVNEGVFSNPHVDAPQSLMSDENKKFVYTEMPYSFKLLTQELNAMSIKAKFVLDKSERERAHVDVDEPLEDVLMAESIIDDENVDEV